MFRLATTLAVRRPAWNRTGRSAWRPGDAISALWVDEGPGRRSSRRPLRVRTAAQQGSGEPDRQRPGPARRTGCQSLLEHSNGSSSSVRSAITSREVMFRSGGGAAERGTSAEPSRASSRLTMGRAPRRHGRRRTDGRQNRIPAEVLAPTLDASLDDHPKLRSVSPGSPWRGRGSRGAALRRPSLAAGGGAASPGHCAGAHPPAAAHPRRIGLVYASDKHTKTSSPPRSADRVTTALVLRCRDPTVTVGGDRVDTSRIRS